MNYVKTATLLLAMLWVIAACTSAPKFSEVEDKDWELVEAWHKTEPQPEDISFERDRLKTEGFSEIFTLRFDAKDKRINGVGAPNRFFAPYTLGSKQDISIGMVGQTQMVALHEPEKLKEHDYLAYLQNATAWNLTDKKLELHSADADGVEVVLYFVHGGKITPDSSHKGTAAPSTQSEDQSGTAELAN